MAKQKLIVRSYGSVELIEKQGVPLLFRYHKMKKEKKRIYKTAAELVKDGEVIFIDPSSTTEYIAPYLVDKKNIVTQDSLKYN